MGAHALGGATLINSGYTGQWTPGKANVFDNEYYKRLNDASLTFTNRVRLQEIL